METTRHVSVLEREVLEYLEATKGPKSFLDCTLGGAGHTLQILEAHPENTVFAIDRDMRAINRAQEKLAPYKERVQLEKSTFIDLVDDCDGKTFDCIFADLGTSMDQIHEGRGFSFRDDGPLDMRMDEDQELTADNVVNGYELRQLRQVFLKGGVGKYSNRIAQKLIDARPVESTSKARSVITAAIPVKDRKKNIDPSTVAFQALRIEVNKEFENIEALLAAVPKLSKSDGKLAVISFHSLEDKLVTRALKSWEGEEFSALWPGGRSKNCQGRLLTRKAITASEDELSVNPSSRSARMRVFQFDGES